MYLKLILPPEYPYDVVGGQRNIKVADFDEKVDISTDCRSKYIFTVTKNKSMAQTELQLAQCLTLECIIYMKHTEICILRLV